MLTCYNLACRTLKSAEALAADLPNTTAQSLDVSFEDPVKQAALEKAIAEHDLVISLVPYTYHVNVIKAAIKGKTNVVTTSYISPGIRELEDEIKKAGIVVLNEIGLDPGVDHLYAIKTIDEVHAKGGKVSIGNSKTSCAIADEVVNRSKSSTRTAAASPRQNAPTTPSGTSSRGRRAAACSSSSTTPPTSPTASGSPSPAAKT